MFWGLVSIAYVLVGPSFADTEEVLDARTLASVVDLDGLSVSDNGRSAVFQTRRAIIDRNTYQLDWLVVSLDGDHQVRRVADGGEVIIASLQGRLAGEIIVPRPEWSPDGDWFVIAKRQGGRTELWRVREGGQGSEQLTQSASDVIRFRLSDDGQRLFYELDGEEFAARREQVASTGSLYDRRFFPSYSREPVMPSSHSFVSDRAQEWVDRRRVYDLAVAAQRPLTPSEHQEFAAMFSRSAPEGRPQARGRAVLSNAGNVAWAEALNPSLQGGLAPVTIVAQLNEGTPIVCTSVECTSQRLLAMWWDSEERLAFAQGEGLRDTSIYSWDVRSGTVRHLLRTQSRILANRLSGREDRSCEMARARLICFLEESHRPRRLVAIDVDSGSTSDVYDPNPGFANLKLGQIEPFTIVSATGVRAAAILVLPETQTQRELPLVIVTYRCSGFLRGGTGDEYPIFPLVAEGMAVLCIDIPTEDLDMLARMDWPTYQTWTRGPGSPMKRRIQGVIDAAVERLVQSGRVDPTRIAMTGLNYGAESTSYALFSAQRPLATAILSGAGFEPSSYYLYGPAGRELLQTMGLSMPVGRRSLARWREFSLTLNAGRVFAPVLFNVSDHEMMSALEPVAALEDLGKPVEMHIHFNEYHTKWQPVHRLAIYERNIDWLRFWLLGEEDGVAEKAEQYLRWRRMRAMIAESGSSSAQRSSESRGADLTK